VFQNSYQKMIISFSELRMMILFAFAIVLPLLSSCQGKEQSKANAAKRDMELQPLIGGIY
jgi:hypothetical protein